MIEVLRGGPLTTVQDLGRPGWAHVGVPRSGALDQPALRLANRIVGNPENAAGLEITVGGCALRLRVPAVVALTGGLADLVVNGAPVALGVAVPVRAGAIVEVGPARLGLRSYLAFSGGVDLPPVLGSRSTDTLSGLGPPALAAGHVLPIGAPAGHPSTVDFVPWSPLASPLLLRITFGPRQDWFTDGALRTLTNSTYHMSPLSNRVGARLAGPALTRGNAGELPSEGIVLGAVQVPPDGQPVVFLADHPTTGGYPVVAVVEATDLPGLAQSRPGSTVRFCGPER